MLKVGETSAQPGGIDAATWDGAAVEALFRAHYASLCGFVFRMVRSRDVAEDLVQDAFVGLWAQRDRLEVRTSVKAYLFRAARNRALNWLEHQGIARSWAERQAQAPLDAPLPSSPPAADAAVEAAELRQALLGALETLPERCREVMRLRYLEQMSHAEIAEVMQISVKGVEIQLGRGLKALRSRLTGAP